MGGETLASLGGENQSDDQSVQTKNLGKDKD